MIYSEVDFLVVLSVCARPRCIGAVRSQTLDILILIHVCTKQYIGSDESVGFL